MGPGRLKYLLDSVVLIDHFNGIEAATEFLEEHGGACAISVITRAEVLAGFDESGARLALELLNLFVTFPVTVEVADTAAALRRSQRWKLPDALQAAIAKHHELVLVTRNTRDFQAGGTPEVWVPYRL
jgi:predicted nucleic acid-binding protein